MRKSVIGCALVAVLMLPGGAFANSIAVTPAAALEGSFGMAVTMDRSTNKAYVQDGTPNAEKTYNATWLFQRNTWQVDPPPNPSSVKRNSIFVARQILGPGQVVTVMRLMLINTVSFGHIIRMGVLNDTGGIVHCGDFTLPVGATGIREIHFEWAAATAPGANDGFCRLYRNGNLIKEVTNIDNDTVAVDRAQLGAMEGDLANASGTGYFDSFVSTR